MRWHSCLYEGQIRHRRFAVPAHEFCYRLYMFYVDLTEWPEVGRRSLGWLHDPWFVWFRRADHYGDPSVPLEASVRELVFQRTGIRPSGPIRLLTHMRIFGFFMNPIGLYYCFDPDERLQFIVAEVNNTPWNEQHCYVLEVCDSNGICHARAEKELHVSPFLGMEFDYSFRMTQPGAKLLAHVENHERHPAQAATGVAFAATLDLRQIPLTSRNHYRLMARYGWMTLRVWLAIYWQAARLWFRGARFHPHPRLHTPVRPTQLPTEAAIAHSSK